MCPLRFVVKGQMGQVGHIKSEYDNYIPAHTYTRAYKEAIHGTGGIGCRISGGTYHSDSLENSSV